MNGQIVVGRGLGRRESGLKDNMILQKSLCKQILRFPTWLPKRTADRQQEQRQRHSHKGRYRSRRASCISLIHFIKSRPRITVRKSPPDTRDPLFLGLSCFTHTLPDEMLELLLLFLQNPFDFFPHSTSTFPNYLVFLFFFFPCKVHCAHREHIWKLMKSDENCLD